MTPPVHKPVDKLPGQITRALNRFEQAVRDMAWIGAQELEAAELIEEEYEAAKQALKATLARALLKASTGSKT